MSTYVLDASAILRYTDNEPGADRIEELLNRAAEGSLKLLLSAVNWGEIATVLCKRHGLAGAKTITGNLSPLPIIVVNADKEHAEDAGYFKWNFNIPYADAFAGSLALREQATLVTADYDFKNVAENTIEIEFLPGK